jgi:hypothetical protein
MIPGKTVGSVSDAACFEQRQSADARIQSCRQIGEIPPASRCDRPRLQRPPLKQFFPGGVSASRPLRDISRAAALRSFDGHATELPPTSCSGGGRTSRGCHVGWGSGEEIGRLASVRTRKRAAAQPIPRRPRPLPTPWADCLLASAAGSAPFCRRAQSSRPAVAARVEFRDGDWRLVCCKVMRRRCLD